MAIYPNVMVPLQIDLAMGFDGTCSVACVTQGVQRPAIQDMCRRRSHRSLSEGSAKLCVRFRIG